MEMKLEEIGFYTLSDKRVMNVAKNGVNTPLSRCELILTDKCNFKCPYCRKLRSDIQGTIPHENAKFIVDGWVSHGLKNVRFSGGEPTLYKHLPSLVNLAKNGGTEHIAVSTNGSANPIVYEKLLRNGVNDFSISLDACCTSFGEKMSGGIKGSWEKVVNTIKTFSNKIYVLIHTCC